MGILIKEERFGAVLQLKEEIQSSKECQQEIERKLLELEREQQKESNKIEKILKEIELAGKTSPPERAEMLKSTLSRIKNEQQELDKKIIPIILEHKRELKFEKDRQETLMVELLKIKTDELMHTREEIYITTENVVVPIFARRHINKVYELIDGIGYLYKEEIENPKQISKSLGEFKCEIEDEIKEIEKDISKGEKGTRVFLKLCNKFGNVCLDLTKLLDSFVSDFGKNSEFLNKEVKKIEEILKQKPIDKKNFIGRSEPERSVSDKGFII